MGKDQGRVYWKIQIIGIVYSQVEQVVVVSMLQKILFGY